MSRSKYIFEEWNTEKPFSEEVTVFSSLNSLPMLDSYIGSILSLHPRDETEAPQKEQRQDQVDLIQGELYNKISWPSDLLRVNT